MATAYYKETVTATERACSTQNGHERYAAVSVAKTANAISILSRVILNTSGNRFNKSIAMSGVG